MKKETSQSPGSAQDRKMSKGELISYGLGGVASTMPSQFKTSYAMNFMSDVAGLHVGAVGVLFSIVSLLISLIFIPMMPAVLKKVGKIKTVLYGMALIVLPAIWLMIRRESMSDLKVVASSFCSSFSTTIVGVALAAVGYSADSVSQEVIDMIINIKIIYPFILLIVTGLILHFYPITPEFARKMRAELKERRTAAAAAKQA